MPSPSINGVPYDFSSLEISSGRLIFEGATGIKYEHGMQVEKLQGRAKTPLGRTPGYYNAEDGELTMLRSDYIAWIKDLGPGYMTKVFQISASYAYPDEPVQCDELIDCRIIKDAHDHKKGPAGLEVSVTISIMRVKVNGVDPVDS